MNPMTSIRPKSKGYILEEIQEEQFYKFLKTKFKLTEKEFINLLKDKHPEVLI